MSVNKSKRPREKPGTETTRNRLIETAIEMFAERGMHGVSLREIGERAGAKNTGAVHYHLGDRRSLIIAALDLVTTACNATITVDAAAALGLKVPKSKDPRWNLVAHAMLPVATLPLRRPWGGAGIGFLTRIITGEGTDFAVDLETRLLPGSDELARALAPHIPAIDSSTLQRRIDFMFVSVVCGMATLAYSREVSRAGITPDIDDGVHFAMLVDYAVGGLIADATVKHG